MPKMNGIDSIQAIRKKRPQVPIIVITSFQDQFTEPLARLNVQEVLIKPVMITQLVRSVRKVVESGPSGPA
jgi:YesN/AraC family two-component response regulator